MSNNSIVLADVVVVEGVVENAPVNYLTEAVAHHIVAVNLHNSAEAAFEVSARSFANAVENGVKVRALVEAIKVAVAESGVVGAYTSVGAVGFHARTGLVARLDGDLPEDVTLRNVQTLIKKVSAKVADDIIKAASDRGAAYAALLDAVNSPAPVAGTDEGGSDEGEGAGEPVEEKVVTALDLLTAATASIEKAAGLIERDGADDATIAALDSLLAILGQARVSATDVPEDAEPLFTA